MTWKNWWSGDLRQSSHEQLRMCSSRLVTVDDKSLCKRMSEHTYLTLYLLGVMGICSWLGDRTRRVGSEFGRIDADPDTFMKLTTLSYLDLSGNQLTQLQNLLEISATPNLDLSAIHLNTFRITLSVWQQTMNSGKSFKPKYAIWRH